jgi:TRAP-type C4-dicarboxylate transport system permease small subunit
MIYAIAMLIIFIMVSALCLSALTRYVSGNGYDWFIELPPVLVSWLVFPLLGPLLKNSQHIQVDFLSSFIKEKNIKFVKLFSHFIALGASLIFMKAGYDATLLYYNMGQIMEIELEIPLWWMYLAFPAGFFFLGLFSLELIFEEVNQIHKKYIK